MAKTLIGIVDKPLDAQTIIDELTTSCHCDREDIGLMMRDAAANDAAHAARSAVTHAADAAQAGGKAFADLWRAGANLVSRAVPGMGAVKAVGPLGASFIDVAFGAAATLARALANAGLSESDARCAAEAIERGGVLLTVHAQTDNIARCAEGVLSRHGALRREPRAA